MSGCTAALYATQTHVSVLEFLLRNGAHADINTPSERPPVDEEEDMRRSHPFEAVLFAKIQNISALLHAGAEAQAVMNPEKQISILYQCAEYGFEEIPTLEKSLVRGVGIDTGPLRLRNPFRLRREKPLLQAHSLPPQTGREPKRAVSNGSNGFLHAPFHRLS